MENTKDDLSAFYAYKLAKHAVNLAAVVTTIAVLAKYGSMSLADYLWTKTE